MPLASNGSRYLVWLLVSICIFSALSGCSPGINKQIIGKWERTNGGVSELIEFNDDGSYSKTYSMALALGGNYKFTKGDQLEFSSNGEVFQTAHASIANDILTLSLPNNASPAIYKRAGSNPTQNLSEAPSNSQLESQSLADYNKAQMAISPVPNTNPPKLSAAAERAIREGFVEIKDPAVQACTDARVAEIKKANGSDSAISFETYNEEAVKCGFNI